MFPVNFHYSSVSAYEINPWSMFQALCSTLSSFVTILVTLTSWFISFLYLLSFYMHCAKSLSATVLHLQSIFFTEPSSPILQTHISMMGLIDLLIDWLRQWGETCLNQGHQRAYCSFPGDMWSWRSMVMIMPAKKKNWLIHQSSLAILPAESSGSKKEEWMKEWELFAYSVSEIPQGNF
jgi:hypothetical protein